MVGVPIALPLESTSSLEPVLPPLELALSPFGKLLVAPRLRALAERTLGWAWEIQLLDPGADSTKITVVSCVYAHLCRPTTATDRQLDIAARLCLLFFCIDDAEPDELTDLTTPTKLWDVGPLTPYLARWRAEFVEMERAAASVTACFTQGFHDYLRHRAEEPASRGRALPLAEHWTCRRQTVFIDPYVDQWILSMGLSPNRIAHPAFDRCRRIVIDVVLIANDLGSLERDRVGGEAEHDLNLVHTYMRDNGWSEAGTVEHLTRMHNELIAEFRRASRVAVAELGTDDAAAFADVMCGIIDGNRAALGVLHFRYPGIAEVVARLDTVARSGQ
ncbi:MAG: terpene synthase family protein [Deltaproteobacteria bacterium]|nr:terpene synthase family protein [Deltaproteobacteria bacterium]